MNRKVDRKVGVEKVKMQSELEQVVLKQRAQRLKEDFSFQMFVIHTCRCRRNQRWKEMLKVMDLKVFCL